MLASIYEKLGNLNRVKEQYTEALDFYEKALDIGLETLPDNHPFLLKMHSFIGDIKRI